MQVECCVRMNFKKAYRKSGRYRLTRVHLSGLCRRFSTGGGSPASPAALAFRIMLSCLVVAAAFFGSGCTRFEKAASVPEPSLPRRALLKKWQDMNQGPAVSGIGPLTLDQAIEDALRASPRLEQIRSRVDAASRQIKQAEAAFYPRITISEDFNVTNNPVYALMNIINQRRLQPNVNFNNPGQERNFSTRIQGEWSLFQGGRRWYEREAALNRRESVEAGLLAGRNELVAKVAETYYRWLQALSFISVAEKSFKAARTDERLGAARVRAQVALPSDLLRLKARTAEMNGKLVTARTGARKLQAAMERLLARPLHSAEIPTPPFSASADAEIVEKKKDYDLALVAHALANRPEIEGAEALIRAARNRVGSAAGGFLPEIGTSANYQWDAEDPGNGANSWMVAVRLTWPLFEGGVTRAKLGEARSRLKEMEAHGKQVALDVALEVHEATLAVQDAADKIQVADERRRYASSAMEEIRHQYKNEVAGVDALLQAQVAWTEAEASYTAALFEGRIAQTLLKQSLGDFSHWMEASNQQPRF